MPLIDLTGKRFGRLEVIKQGEKTKAGNIRWICKCDCGNETAVLGENLRYGHTKSCGCLHSEVTTKHGGSDSRLYTIWSLMKRRCLTKTASDYARYGGRGITVCEEWINDFSSFYDWAVNNGYKPHLTLDRRNNNGSYSPENCHWATAKEQQNNTRFNHLLTYNGRTLTIAQWSEETEIPYATLLTRIKRGWSVERSLTEPIKKKRVRAIDADRAHYEAP